MEKHLKSFSERNDKAVAKSEIKDLTSGKPFKLILGFAVPMLLGFIFQQFYSMVDTIIVGKYLGVKALAAIGSTGSINFMIIGFCIGMCSGFAIPVAQKFGEGDYRGLRRFVVNAAWLSLIFSIVMAVIVCLLCRQILLWMQTPEDIIDQAYSYIFIIFAGIPATYLYNMTAGIIRSLGDSRTPVYFLLLSSIINIFLDLFTILVMKMGLEGAAYATVASQAISGALCLLYMKRHFEILKIREDERKIDGRIVKTLYGMGLPMGLQYSITAIGSVILQASVNTLGSMAVAAVAAGSKVNLFFCCPFDALGGTMATYAGQNVGAGKLDRIKEGLKSASFIGCVYSLAAFLFLLFFGQEISLLFVDAGEVEIISQVAMFLIINSAFYIPLVFVNVVRFTIQGMGFSTFAILAGVFEMVARGWVGLVMVPMFGYTAACFGSPLAWILADIFLIPAFCYCLKSMKVKFGNR